MVQPGEPGSNEKSFLGYDSSEPRIEYLCPKCFKTFYTTSAICAHQNAHSLIKEPLKMSPVLAAVLNSTPPPSHKPILLPTRPKPSPGGAITAAKEPTANQPPRYHPYRRVGEEPSPNQLQDVDDFLRLRLGNKPRCSQPTKTVVPGYEKDTRSPAKDLLGEWMPITGFGDYAELGTSSGKMLFLAVTTDVEPEPKPKPELDLELSLRTSTTAKRVDLELKLGC